MKDEDSKEGSNRNHLNAREMACIHLRIPDSGTAWLDDLIRQRVARDEKAKAVSSDPAQFPLFEGGGT